MPKSSAQPTVVPQPGNLPPYLLHDQHNQPIEAVTEFLKNSKPLTAALPR